MRFLCIYKPAKAEGALPTPEMMETMGNFIVAGTKEEAWATLTAALGLNGVDTGQRWAVPAGSRRLAARWSTSARVIAAPCCGSTSRGPAPPPCTS